MADRLKYDVLPMASRLYMPVLLIVGENDTSTPPQHVRLLYDTLSGPKEFHIIKGAPHTFLEPEHLAEIEQLFINWIDNIPRLD